MKLQYTLIYAGDVSKIRIPQLEGLALLRRPDDIYTDDRFLDLMHFAFSAWFNPYNSTVFTEIEIQKQGGNDQLPRATSYYEQLTRAEADCIISEIIRTSLGIIEFELDTDSEDLIEANGVFDDEEELTDEDLESAVIDLLDSCDEDFSDVDEYLDDHGDEYSGDLAEFAFREAIRRGMAAYVEEHADDFDLNDGGDCSTFLNETDDEDIIAILMDHGAFRSWEDYDDCLFAMETVNGEILAFATDFQKRVYQTYKESTGLTDARIAEILEDGIYDDTSGRDVEDDLSRMGVRFSDGSLSFDDICGQNGYDTMELIEELGWECAFEGDSWKLETLGVYFIREA